MISPVEIKVYFNTIAAFLCLIPLSKEGCCKKAFPAISINYPAASLVGIYFINILRPRASGFGFIAYAV